MIEVNNLGFRFPQAREPLFRKIHFEAGSGARVALVGPSGSGKTSFIRLLVGLLVPDAGNIQYAGKKLDMSDDGAASVFRNHQAGVIFQNYNLLGDLSVADNLNLRYAVAGLAPDKNRIMAMLEQVELREFIDQKVRKLSGGQRQRVAAVRALLTEPSYIFADEPTGNLDDHSARLVIDLLAQQNQEHTVIASTHDPRLIERLDTKIMLEELEAGP